MYPLYNRHTPICLELCKQSKKCRWSSGSLSSTYQQSASPEPTVRSNRNNGNQAMGLFFLFSTAHGGSNANTCAGIERHENISGVVSGVNR